MQGFRMTRRSMLFSLAGLLMAAMLTLGGCGGSDSTGSGSYPDPTPAPPVVTTTKAPTILTADVLKQWVDEGKVNAPLDDADRVVIVSPSTVADWTAAAKGHIPGAVRWGTDELAKDRIEGLAMAGSMMPDGPMMDGIIQRLGITGTTTIVISLPKNSSIYNQSLTYWDLRYWGFPRERVKILNGGDDAWEAAGHKLSIGATEKYTASTYSVGRNSGLNTAFRYSIGETIVKVDAMMADPALKNTWQLLEVRGVATSPYMTNALRLPSATMFLTRLNGDATKNFIYPDKATLEQRMATMAVTDGANADARISPTKKTIAMCGTSTSASPTFVLFDAVLEVPAGNIALYDGSASQWNFYSTARLTAAYPTAAPGQIEAWAFDNAVNPRAQGTIPSASVFNDWTALSLGLGPNDAAMNQIEAADREYMNKMSGSTGGTTGGGSTGGGSGPSGC